MLILNKWHKFQVISFFPSNELKKPPQFFLKLYFSSLSWIQIEHWSEAENNCTFKLGKKLLHFWNTVHEEKRDMRHLVLQIYAHISVFTHTAFYVHIHWHASSCQDLWITQFKPIKSMWRFVKLQTVCTDMQWNCTELSPMCLEGQD